MFVACVRGARVECDPLVGFVFVVQVHQVHFGVRVLVAPLVRVRTLCLLCVCAMFVCTMAYLQCTRAL